MSSNLIQLMLGAVCIAFAPIFVRLTTMGPTESAFARCFLAFLILLPLALRSCGLRLLLRTWASRALIIAGAIFSLDLFVWHKAVVYSGAGTGTLLANTQVFYLGLVGYFCFKERLSWHYVLWTLLAFAGIAMLVLSKSQSTEFPNYELGVVLGLLTGVIYASYILAMRWGGLHLSRVNIVTKVCMVSFWSAFFLIPLAYLEGLDWKLVQIDWLCGISLALVPQIGGWILITRSLGKIDISLSGLIILLQPVMAFIFAWLILSEKLNFWQILGASLTILSIFKGERVRSELV